MALRSISATMAPNMELLILASASLEVFCRSRTFSRRSGSLLSWMFLMEALSMLTMALARLVLNFWIPMIFSSRVSLVISRYTFSTRFWPMRCARSIACMSTVGLQSLSNITTQLAEDRFSPTPPMALVTNKILMSLSPLKVCATVKRSPSRTSEVSLRQLMALQFSLRKRSMRSTVLFSLAKMSTLLCCSVSSSVKPNCSNSSPKAMNFPESSKLHWLSRSARQGWLTILTISCRLPRALISRAWLCTLMRSSRFSQCLSWQSVSEQQQSLMIFSGSSRSTSPFILRMMKGITLKCSFSRVLRCSSEKSSSSSLKVVRFTSNSFSQCRLNTSSLQRQPGMRKSKSPHSSMSLFWMGVPVRMKRCSPFSFLMALNLLVLVFLMRCPSSRMMKRKLSFSNCSCFSTMEQLVMKRWGVRRCLPASPIFLALSRMTAWHSGEGKYFLYSQAQCCISVFGQMIRLCRYSSLPPSAYSFSSTTSVCSVFPSPMSSHSAPLRLYRAKKPSQVMPSSWQARRSIASDSFTVILQSKLEVFLKFLTNSTPSQEMAARVGEKGLRAMLVQTPTMMLERLFMARSCSFTQVMDLMICRMKSEETEAILTMCSVLIFSSTSQATSCSAFSSDRNHSKNTLEEAEQFWLRKMKESDSTRLILTQMLSLSPEVALASITLTFLVNLLTKQPSSSRGCLSILRRVVMVPLRRVRRRLYSSSRSGTLPSLASMFSCRQYFQLSLRQSWLAVPMASMYWQMPPMQLPSSLIDSWCSLSLSSLSWQLVETWVQRLLLKRLHTSFLFLARERERPRAALAVASLMNWQLSSLTASMMALMTMLRFCTSLGSLNCTRYLTASILMFLLSSRWILTMLFMMRSTISMSPRNTGSSSWLYSPLSFFAISTPFFMLNSLFRSASQISRKTSSACLLRASPWKAGLSTMLFSCLSSSGRQNLLISLSSTSAKSRAMSLAACSRYSSKSLSLRYWGMRLLRRVQTSSLPRWFFSLFFSMPLSSSSSPSGLRRKSSRTRREAFQMRLSVQALRGQWTFSCSQMQRYSLEVYSLLSLSTAMRNLLTMISSVYWLGVTQVLMNSTTLRTFLLRSTQGIRCGITSHTARKFSPSYSISPACSSCTRFRSTSFPSAISFFFAYRHPISRYSSARTSLILLVKNFLRRSMQLPSLSLKQGKRRSSSRSVSRAEMEMSSRFSTMPQIWRLVRSIFSGVKKGSPRKDSMILQMQRVISSIWSLASILMRHSSSWAQSSLPWALSAWMSTVRKQRKECFTSQVTLDLLLLKGVSFSNTRFTIFTSTTCCPPSSPRKHSDRISAPIMRTRMTLSSVWQSAKRSRARRRMQLLMTSSTSWRFLRESAMCLRRSSLVVLAMNSKRASGVSSLRRVNLWAKPRNSAWSSISLRMRTARWRSSHSVCSRLAMQISYMRLKGLEMVSSMKAICSFAFRFTFSSFCRNLLFCARKASSVTSFCVSTSLKAFSMLSMVAWFMSRKESNTFFSSSVLSPWAASVLPLLLAKSRSSASMILRMSCSSQRSGRGRPSLGAQSSS